MRFRWILVHILQHGLLVNNLADYFGIWNGYGVLHIVGGYVADDYGAGMNSLCAWEVINLVWFIGKYTYQMDCGLPTLK